ncbi:MAG: TetR/AcrR family transcriptional regulator, partial [Notoacmeibacter sp.]|nr:TetR/AcrR family transcriptional regulator [Notoacmeibacter sp.]
HMAAELGLEGLTIGELATRADMSKSGLYAHFRSKESLQIAVLEAAEEALSQAVVRPALKQPRGLPRLRALFDNWLKWKAGEIHSGCPFAAAAADFDDRPGPVRDHLVNQFNAMLDVFSRVTQTAIDAGELRGDIEPEQFAFDLWSVLLGYEQYKRLLSRGDAKKRAMHSFESLIAKARPH